MNTTPVTACNPSLHPMELENISFLYKLPPYDMDFEIVFLRFSFVRYIFGNDTILTLNQGKKS